MSYTIESIVEKIGARRLGNKPAAIDWLLTAVRYAFRKRPSFLPFPPKETTAHATSLTFMNGECAIL